MPMLTPRPLPTRALPAVAASALATLGWVSLSAAAAPPAGSRPLHPHPAAPVAGAPIVCAAPAVASAVSDSAPIKRCPDLPLEQACVADGGIKQGPRWVWDAETACRLPKHTEHYEDGHRVGLAVAWRAVCPTSAPTAPAPAKACTAKVAEIGNYVAGKQDGAWQHFDAAGALVEDRNYQAGRPQGWWRRYAAGQLAEQVCYRDGKELWRGKPGGEGAPEACPDTEARADDDGTVAVDDDQRKASRMVALAQASKNVELRVRYLRRACELAPSNEGYKKLLAAAEAELAAARPAPKP